LSTQDVCELRVIIKSNEIAAGRTGALRKTGVFTVKRYGTVSGSKATAEGMATVLASKHELAGYLDQGNKGSRGGEAAHSAGTYQPRFPSRDTIRAEVERRGIGGTRVRFAGDRAGSAAGGERSRPSEANLPPSAAPLASFDDTNVNSLRERVKFLERFVCRMDVASEGKASAMVSAEDGDPGGLSDAGSNSEAGEESSGRLQEQVVDVVEEVLENVKEKMALASTTAQDFAQA
jgi:hypothetical protein